MPSDETAQQEEFGSSLRPRTLSLLCLGPEHLTADALRRHAAYSIIVRLATNPCTFPPSPPAVFTPLHAELVAHDDWSVAHSSGVRARAAMRQSQILRTRQRQFGSAAAGYAQLKRLVLSLVADVGLRLARIIWLQAEREFWMSRCEVGLLLGRRQHLSGVGWANVDHQVVRCARANFHLVAEILASLGYLRNDGGSVSEEIAQAHFESGEPGETIIVEYDAPDRGDGDQHSPLADLVWPRRVAIWCLLHGDSLLDGGLARVTATYRCAALSRQLARFGAFVTSALPSSPTVFSVAGQDTPIAPSRLGQLQREGLIDRDLGERLLVQGAIAAHLFCADHGHARSAAGRVDLVLDGIAAATTPFTRRRHRLRRSAPRRRQT